MDLVKLFRELLPTQGAFSSLNSQRLSKIEHIINLIVQCNIDIVLRRWWVERVDVLNRDQQRIVHESLITHESHVGPHTLKEFLFVKFIEVDKFPTMRIIGVVMVNTHQEIFILQCVPSSCLAFDFSVNHASFQIENVAKLLFVFKLAGVLHQHDVTVLDVLSVDCVNTKNFRKQTVLISFVVLSKGWQALQVHVELAICHGLNDELVVVGEEEKTA